MNLNINLETMYEYGLTPSEYIVLFLIKNNKLDAVKFDIEKPLQRLIDKKFIGQDNQLSIKIPHELFGENKVEDLESHWIQFKSEYPKKDGPRRLHDSPTPCKVKYLKLLKKDATVHNLVLKGIRTEVSLRDTAERRGDFFPAPKLMSTYINNKSWEGYLDEDNNDQQMEKDLI